ncbi:MAG: hypothetical protein CCU26_17540 [Nitrospira sp. UW-LDO-01]|nr:MAG: hypothetical protein CCU26_17540 [Nitrospira sp. UW-LDO-01]
MSHLGGHFHLAKELMKKGDLDGAIAEHRLDVGLNPRDVCAHSNLAFALQRKGDLKGAMAEYRTVLRLDAGHVSAHFKLGNELKKMGTLMKRLQSIVLSCAWIPTKGQPATLWPCRWRKRGS